MGIHVSPEPRARLRAGSGRSGNPSDHVDGYCAASSAFFFDDQG
jgi:hypothetical protein